MFHLLFVEQNLGVVFAGELTGLYGGRGNVGDSGENLEQLCVVPSQVRVGKQGGYEANEKKNERRFAKGREVRTVQTPKYLRPSP